MIRLASVLFLFHLFFFFFCTRKTRYNIARLTFRDTLRAPYVLSLGKLGEKYPAHAFHVLSATVLFFFLFLFLFCFFSLVFR